MRTPLSRREQPSNIIIFSLINYAMSEPAIMLALLRTVYYVRRAFTDVEQVDAVRLSVELGPTRGKSDKVSNLNLLKLSALLKTVIMIEKGGSSAV